MLAYFVHGIGAAAAIHAMLKSSTPQIAYTWAVALVALPWLAIPLYVLFGSRHFDDYVNPLRSGSLFQSRTTEDILRQASSIPTHLPAAEQRATLSVLQKLCRVHFSQGNQVELLVDGLATYQRMTDEIMAAQEYVLVLFYKIVDDEAGRNLQQLLCHKAQQRVKVYLVFDEFGSHTLKDRFLGPLRKAGVQCWPFRTASGWRNKLQLNFRNHRKIVVVDGSVALVGGLNVADKYLGKSSFYGAWRDTHTVLRGPAVLAVQLAFAEDYFWASAGQIPDLQWAPRLSDQENFGCTYLSFGPTDNLPKGLMLYLECIHAARHRLWLASPYFLPDPSILNALRMAVMRGVDVRVLLPPGRYEPIMRWAMHSLNSEMRNSGIRFFEYPTYNHSKVMLVDDWFAWVGSSNLDNRSLRLNFEGNLLVADGKFAGQMAKMLEADFQKSTPLDLRELNRMTLKTRFACKLTRLLQPLL